MTLHVHLRYPPSAEGLTYLQAHLHPDVQLTMGVTYPEPATYHILVDGRPTSEVLQASPNLHTLIIPWAGLPTSTQTLLTEFPHLAVHNLHHNGAIVAELMLGLLLAAAKLIIPFDQALRRHDWTPRYQRPSPALLLAGKTVVILGYGAIGQQMAVLCHALGMKVLATRRRVRDHDPEWIYASDAILDLLPQAHVLLICLPHTSETDGLIGEAELALLPSKAVLINVGRGPIVVEKALYEALRDGRLHSAGLDVWYHYPTDIDTRTQTPPATYPWHELDNVVMSPHRGGGSDETEQRRLGALAELLNCAACGEPLPNLVDGQAGY